MASVSTHATNGNGRPQHAVRDRHFPIHDSRKIWIVTRGKIDVFLQIVDEDHRAGARFHVMRAEEGQAILGIDLSERPYVSLIACQAQGPLRIQGGGFGIHQPT